MQIASIEPDQTELGAKKEELESVDRPWEDPQQPSVNQKKSKLKKMRGFVKQLRANLGKANEDLA
jgi:hypothetical protein